MLSKLRGIKLLLPAVNDTNIFWSVSFIYFYFFFTSLFTRKSVMIQSSFRHPLSAMSSSLWSHLLRVRFSSVSAMSHRARVPHHAARVYPRPTFASPALLESI
jgi:hypothetical protein